MKLSRRSILLLLFLFAASGASALIYEIVWFQLLELVIGSSAVSLGLLLATFMGGTCLGSIGFPRLIPDRWNPLRVYAVVEFGIALSAIAVLLALPFASGWYVSIGDYGEWDVLVRALLCGICLLPPSLLIGATFPAIARAIAPSIPHISWMGYFYGVNIAGAVAGSMAAGFYLLRVHDMYIATYVAAAINLLTGGIAFALAPSARGLPSSEMSGAGAKGYSRIYLVIALSGLTALGGEVVWTRLLSLILGASTYSFSIILAVFLSGLGLGSAFGSVLSARTTNPGRVLAICQILAAVTVAWAAHILSQVLPFLPSGPESGSPWLGFSQSLLRCAMALLPACVFWGASFPLALAALRARGDDAGRLVSSAYAANTLGAIVGAVAFSLALTPWFGTQGAQQLLIAIAGAAGLMLMATNHGGRKLRSGIVMCAIGVLITIAIWTVPPIPPTLIAYGPFTAQTLAQLNPATREPFNPNIVFSAEGRNASVAVSETPAGYRNFHVSGKIEASTEPQDMRLQRMLGHLPALLHNGPRSVLIVGFGAGVTAGTFVTYPGVERIVICEIEPLIPDVVSRYFSNQNNNVLSDPRVELIYDDARHYLLKTSEKFDIITYDPIHPWVKGAATLYTREFIELVKNHLNPGGVVSQWVPLYQSSFEAVRSELATFFDIFPNATVWSNDVSGRGYDIVLLGRDSEAPISLDDLSRRLSEPSERNTMESLKEVGFGSSIDLLATYAGRASDLKQWLEGAEINRDRNLRLQYLAGMDVLLDQGAAIHNAILERRQSLAIFQGSVQSLHVLRLAIEQRRPRRIDESQAVAIRRALAGKPPRQLSISAVAGDSEAMAYARQIRQAIIDAGWNVEDVQQIVPSSLVVGILISVGSDPPPPQANELFTALRAAGLVAPGYVDPSVAADRIGLIVGQKQ